MTLKKTFSKLPIFLSSILIFSGCTDKDEVAKVELNVRLTDAPGDFEEVNIEIKEVQVHTKDGNETSGWITLANINQGVYNLLDFTNGYDTLLASDRLPVGKISQIRLVLGSNNTVKIGGQLYPLNTPAAQQSGLKLKVNKTLVEDIKYTLLLDFDASQSVVADGTGGYNLKPVVRLVTEPKNGAIAGHVVPAGSQSAVLVINGSDTTGTYTDNQGKFLIKGLLEGEYKLIILPKEIYQQTIINKVHVSNGIITEMGEVEINEM